METTIHTLATENINPWLPGRYFNHDVACAYPPVDRASQLKTFFRFSSPVSLIGMIALLMWFLVHFQETMRGLGAWAYLGVFLAELGNSAALLFPTPGPAYTMAMALILNPLLMGILGGIGAALGELTGYYLGTKGRRVIQQGRLYHYLHALAHKRTELAILAFAALPVPFDFVGLWAGAVRYPLLRFFLFLMLGKIIKVTVVALTISYGFHRLLGPLG